jgi:hypothetical protein
MIFLIMTSPYVKFTQCYACMLSVNCSVGSLIKKQTILVPIIFYFLLSVFNEMLPLFVHCTKAFRQTSLTLPVESSRNGMCLL